MERIISGIDHKMNDFLVQEPEKANELWQSIKNREHILKQATTVISGRNGNLLFAPAICYMILTNPQDVEPKFYESFVNCILSSRYLSRLSVINNISFSSAIAIYGHTYLNNRTIQKLSADILLKGKDKPYMVRNVKYNEIMCEEEKTTRFIDNAINIFLSRTEVYAYSKREHISIEEEVNLREIETLFEYANMNSELDSTLRNSIYTIYTNSYDYRFDNDIDYGIDEVTPKL